MSMRKLDLMKDKVTLKPIDATALSRSFMIKLKSASPKITFSTIAKIKVSISIRMISLAIEMIIIQKTALAQI